MPATSTGGRALVRLAVLTAIAAVIALAALVPSLASASSGGASDARYTHSAPSGPHGKAVLRHDGTAIAPVDAPRAIKAVIAAGNKIAKKPYVYGGGHGSWNSRGYDCSGSVSYALHGGRLLNTPMDSSALARYGKSRYGRWITIYANSGHVYMYVAGLRFDTSGARAHGTRWQREKRSGGGYTVRHPRGF